jgi:hypothetical protein
MKRLVNAATGSLILFVLLGSAHSQGTRRISETNVAVETPTTEVMPSDVALFQQRKTLLEKRLSTLSPASPDYLLITDWIHGLAQRIGNGKHSAFVGSSSTTLGLESSQLPQQEATQEKTRPRLVLSRPIDGKTNEDLQLRLAWTEDHPCSEIDLTKCPVIVRAYRIKGVRAELATDKKKVFGSDRFANPIFVSDIVVSDGATAGSVNVPKDILQSGETYFWQVVAEYDPNGSTDTLVEVVSDQPASFKTASQHFLAFESRGLTLQRAVAGDDADGGAQFGFLKTFNKKTVYTADFALIYNRKAEQTQETSFGFQASVQGNLTSAESESEDALQFRAGAIIDKNLKRSTLNGLYISLAAKYEADQKFRVGKLVAESMVTPTFPILGIGIPFGRSSRYFEFRWRPFFYFDLGRSFKKGASAETQDTVLRLTPRVTAVLTLKFLRRRLNLNDASVFVDDYFYYLPLENNKKRHNMFTSGFTFQMTKNFGFGLTYKKGEAAPKFKAVHTFGGVLTIRFGKDE